MDWNKIKEQYPKAFYNFKKAYLLYEMMHHGKLLLMEAIKYDHTTGLNKYQSFDESLLVYYFANHKIKFSMKFSMVESFELGFEMIEEKLK